MSGIQEFLKKREPLAAITKLTIESYLDPEQTKQNNPFMFVAQYNPTTFQSSHSLKYMEEKTLTGPKKEMRYNGHEASTYSFDLILDGTGSSLPSDISAAAGMIPAVDKMIKRFMEVAYGYVGDAHRASYLKIKWGSNTLARCVLNSANITYDLFFPSGDPMRAKIGCSFKEYTYEEINKAEGGANSPDMTHIRVVQQGDRLPLMCERIYGDAKLYLEVARYNGLTNYRQLIPGQKIYFPPLIATKS